MKVTVLLFGILKDVFGLQRESVEVAPGATLGSLLDTYRQRAPQSTALLSTIATAVNNEFAALSTKLRDGDEIALLPPVSGG